MLQFALGRCTFPAFPVRGEEKLPLLRGAGDYKTYILPPRAKRVVPSLKRNSVC